MHLYQLKEASRHEQRCSDGGSQLVMFGDAINNVRVNHTLLWSHLPWPDKGGGAALEQSPRPSRATALRDWIAYRAKNLNYAFSNGLFLLLGCVIGWHVREPVLRRVQHLRRRYARRRYDPISLLPSTHEVHLWPALLGPRWAPYACRSSLLCRAVRRSENDKANIRPRQGGVAVLQINESSSVHRFGGKRDVDFGDEWRSLPTLLCSWRTGGTRYGGGQGTRRTSPPHDQSLFLLQKQTFDILYDPNARTAVWCGFFLRPDTLAAARRHRRPVGFIADKSLPSTCRTHVRAIRRRGFDKGHLAPHASVAVTPQASLEASQLTNVVLQDRKINRGVWKLLENMSRDYVRLLATAATSANHPTSQIGNEVRFSRLVWSKQRSSSLGSRGPRKGGHPQESTRRAGLVLQQLMREQTPFAYTPSPRKIATKVHGMSWLLPLHRQRRDVQLAVVTGPLFYPKTAGEQGNDVSSRFPRCTNPSSTSVTPRVADAFFMALWDVQTHLHIAFIVPNGTTRSDDKTCYLSTPTTLQHGDGATDSTIGALRRFVVPMERLELAFAASLDLLQGSKVSLRDEITGQASCVFFPLFKRRWRARTWYARLRVRLWPWR